MANYVLVHGAWHGAWCWAEVVRRLERKGHSCRTVDLPGTSDDARSVTGVTLQDCADRVAEAVGDQPDGPAWLVGHSMGGMVIAQAAEQVSDRLAGLVYVTAFLPVDGQTGLDAAVQEDERDRALANGTTIDLERGVSRLDVEQAADLFYQLCDARHVATAKAHLAQWQSFGPILTPVRLTAETSGRVRRFYVECLQDRVLPIDAQRRMQARAGVSAVRALDADHSPFFSTPDALTDALESFLEV